MFNKTLKTYSAKFREFHSQILKLRSTASDRHVPIYRLTILYSTRLSGSSGRSAKCLGIKLWNLSSRKLTFENFILKYYEQQVLGELRVSSKHSGVKLSSFKNSREVYSSSNKIVTRSIHGSSIDIFPTIAYRSLIGQAIDPKCSKRGHVRAILVKLLENIATQSRLCYQSFTIEYFEPHKNHASILVEIFILEPEWTLILFL